MEEEKEAIIEGIKEDLTPGLHPGEISNAEDLINSDEQLDAASVFVNINDNMKEDVEYCILNPKLWKFFHSLYGGAAIKRKAIVLDEDSEPIIEVYMSKLFIYDVPILEKDQTLKTFITSRKNKLEVVRKRLVKARKDLMLSKTRLWKVAMPADI